MDFSFITGSKGSAAATYFMEKDFEKAYRNLDLNLIQCNEKVTPLLKALGILSIENALHYCYVKNLNELIKEYIADREKQGIPPLMAKNTFEGYCKDNFPTYPSKDKERLILPTLFVNAISQTYKGCLFLSEDEDKNPVIKVDKEKLKLSFQHTLTDKEQKKISRVQELVELLNKPGYDTPITTLKSPWGEIYKAKDGKWHMITENVIHNANITTTEKNLFKGFKIE